MKNVFLFFIFSIIFSRSLSEPQRGINDEIEDSWEDVAVTNNEVDKDYESNENLIRGINEVIDLVKTLQKELTYQNAEIKHIQSLIENCSGCQNGVNHNTCKYSNPCFIGVECTDTLEGPTCGRCPRRFAGDGITCREIEICDDDPCFTGVKCTDTDLGAVCGFCPSGYEGDGRACELRRNICETRPCDHGLQCMQINSAPFYSCKPCPPGFISEDGFRCEDIDECSSLNPCDSKVRCTNLAPGFKCDQCPDGYGGHLEAGIYLEAATDSFRRQICNDVDECALRIAQCGPNSKCFNTEGSFNCVCNVGFAVLNSTSGCIPIPGACPDGVTVCDKNAVCKSLGGKRFGCKCKVGFAGDGFNCGGDRDLDGWPDYDLKCPSPLCRQDNCPSVPNSGQEDFDGDGIGDVCDLDIDNDGIKNIDDNCVYAYNPDQSDTDEGEPDRVGDACDNCPKVFNGDQTDTDNDGMGDACDPDIDNDGIFNENDNCPTIANRDQKDTDFDKIGDVCDNCKKTPNMLQKDTDDDLVGDACDNDTDKDLDGIQDNKDNCVIVPNADQADSDGDGRGDSCDTDIDNDGIFNEKDNCPFVKNVDQLDADNNGIGDACELDFDGDGGDNTIDTCPYNNKIISTDFRTFQRIRLDPVGDNQKDPRWLIYNKGAEMVQTLNSDPGMAIGYDSFNGVDFEGTLFVDTEVDDDYIGFIFSYQSNKRFYAVTWKRNPQEYWDKQPFAAFADSGIQIKLVNSKTGPGEYLRNSLWHTGDTTDEVKLLWKDPKNVGWKEKTAYRWHLIHRPKIGLINMKIFNGKRLVVDSGNIFDTTLKGGRLGMYVFSQEMIIWSNMVYRCNDNVPPKIYSKLSPNQQKECQIEAYLKRAQAAMA